MNLKDFWDKQAKKALIWSKPYKDVFKTKEFLNIKPNYFSQWEWFEAGYLDLKKTFFKDRSSNEIFMTYYLNKKEIIEINYASLLNEASKITNNLFEKVKGERIMLVGSASPETTTLILSIALAGKCHCVLFEDLSYQAIKCRIELFAPSALYLRKSIEEEKVLKLQEFCREKNIKVFRYKNQFLKKKDNNLNIPCEELITYKSLPNLEVKADKKLFCLFTSGSTGKPKGIWHSIAPYLVYSYYSFNKFFLESGSSKGIFCGTDAAWINGHTYAIYGPLLAGVRSIFIENLNDLQDPLKLDDFLYKTKPSFFYSSVTLLRAIRSIALITSRQFASINYEGIIGLGSCGEPLADQVGKWAINYFKIKNKFIVNTYFQTETGGVLISPLKENGPIKDHSTVGRNNNLPVEIKVSLKDNSLYIKDPWPGCFSMVTSDKQPNYWNKEKEYLLNDYGFFDSQNFLFIGGRTDDVINISGHRVSTAEIESESLKFDNLIKESAAVGVYDSISGQKIVLFCVLSKSSQFSKNELKAFLNQNLTPYHKPWKIILISCLPKTKSGKIARRLLRKIAMGEKPSEDEDLSTIVNFKNFCDSIKNL